MIDIETHRIIDIIDSRDLKDVKKWLESYKNLQVISRDGSITYKNAITTVHPTAIQVSDRFHLLKNLTDYCKEYLKIKFENNIIVEEKITPINTIEEQVVPQKNKHLSLEEKLKTAKKLLIKGITKSSICKQLNMDIRVLNKLLKMDENELIEYFKTTPEYRQELKATKKMELVTLVRDMYNKNYSMKKIAETLGIDRRTVKKYINPDFSPVHASCGTKKKSILDPYLDEINDLFQKGNSSNAIYQCISQKGYTGSYSNLRHYFTKLKKSRFNQDSIQNKKETIENITIKRKDLLKLLYNPLGDIKGLSTETVDKIKKRYPFFKEIINLIKYFKEILKSKKIAEFDEWLTKSKNINNQYINSFINGITRDLDAVKNAIIYDYNNGLAEGSVNKLKVIKRIMYGRNSFDMLRKKLLRLEKNKRIN